MAPRRSSGGARSPLDRLLASLDSRGQGPPPSPVYLVTGDLVLSAPAAERIAAALAAGSGAEVRVHRRPPSLRHLFDDLRTLSMFEPAKVAVALDTAVLADRQTAAALIDDAAEAVPLAGDGLPGNARAAASRLLQALHLFDADPRSGDPEGVLDELPDWAFQGGPAFRRGRSGRGRGKRQVADLKESLAPLLAAALAEGLEGHGEGDLAELSDLLHGGMPEGHALVLAERSAASDHPLVEALAERGAHVELGQLEEKYGTFSGFDGLADELEGETGVGIRRDALAELARRTLRSERGKRGSVDPDSTARFAGEYRKLAGLAGDGMIDRALVARTVEDRGEEDVFKILDAMGEGRAGEALARLERYLGAAEEPLAARLSFFALLADFCRNLAAVRGLLRLTGVPAGESRYPGFKSRIAPKLQADLPAGGENPVAKLHPYRLHRVYLAACRLSDPAAAALPATVLETERRLKGDSASPDVALAELVGHVARAAGGR